MVPPRRHEYRAAEREADSGVVPGEPSSVMRSFRLLVPAIPESQYWFLAQEISSQFASKLLSTRWAFARSASVNIVVCNITAHSRSFGTAARV